MQDLDGWLIELVFRMHTAYFWLANDRIFPELNI